MKEAIGTTFVFNLVMIFVGVMIALLVGSLAYSKGFKVRNRIINIIEDQNGYTEEAQRAIDENLKAIGYRIKTSSVNCRAQQEKHGGKMIENATKTNYNYCVFENNSTKGKYYGVTVFIHFDIPILGDFVEIPVYGETRIIFDKGTVEG